MFVIAIDEREKALETVDLVRKHFPQLKILARAIDRNHAYELIRRGVEVVERETFSAALEVGVEALKLLGVRSYKARRAGHTFKYHDEQALQEMANVMGETLLVSRSRQLAKQLEQLLRSDDRELAREIDRAWDISDLRKDT